MRESTFSNDLSRRLGPSRGGEGAFFCQGQFFVITASKYSEGSGIAVQMPIKEARDREHYLEGFRRAGLE